MAIKWSDFALQSLVEIILWYEQEAGRNVADSVENRIFKQVDNIDLFPMRAPESDIFPGTRKLVITNLPYVAFIRNIDNDYWEVVDIVHTSHQESFRRASKCRLYCRFPTSVLADFQLNPYQSK